ncbi:KH domain-containing RNA-binding protein QKI isoform X1 [Anolis carolinensis]|uniref:KH domain-containing RNA-binding protein QKI isoform X1 n=1 Tax=Anolis carolinensis TaxID=28377 RepID=UPI002F2B8A27
MPLQRWFINIFKPARHPNSIYLMVLQRIHRFLSWWMSFSNVCKSLPFHPPMPSVTITIDSSKFAWGAHLGNLMIQDLWSPQERAHHINFLKLLAIYKALKAFAHLITHNTVQIQTDNMVEMYYINKLGGTGSRKLMILSTCLWLWCIHHKVSILTLHLPGNNFADSLSRMTKSSHEWQLDSEDSSLHLQRVGMANNQPLCVSSECSATSVRGETIPGNSPGRCLSPRLVGRMPLHLPSNPLDAEETATRLDVGDPHSPRLASPAMVPGSSPNLRQPSTPATPTSPPHQTEFYLFIYLFYLYTALLPQGDPERSYIMARLMPHIIQNIVKQTIVKTHLKTNIIPHLKQ